MNTATPLLRFGVASDLHVTDWASAEIFRRALRWFRDQSVDAVMIPGDLTDHGLMPQLENVARSWHEVFPGDRAPDGRPVEKLFIYGNHDFEGLAYRDKWMDATFAVHGLSHEEADCLQLTKIGLDKAWEQCFGEPYSPIWRKTVKGFDFIGGHSAWNAPKGLEDWFTSNGGALDSRRPFFYIQHPHPKGTVYGPDAPGCDDGTLDMPNYMKNFHFACCLQQQLESDYAGLTRPILFDYRHYNQDLTTGSLLIEVGSHCNTLDQAQYSGQLIGQSLSRLLDSVKEQNEAKNK